MFVIMDRIPSIDRDVPDSLRVQVHADIELRCVRAYDGGEPLSDPNVLVPLYIESYDTHGRYTGDREVTKIPMMQVAQDVLGRMKRLRDFMAEGVAFSMPTSELIFHCHDEIQRVWRIQYTFDQGSWSLKKEFRLLHDLSIPASEAPSFVVLLSRDPVKGEDTLRFSSQSPWSITELPASPTSRSFLSIGDTSGSNISTTSDSVRAAFRKLWAKVLQVLNGPEDASHGSLPAHVQDPDPRVHTSPRIRDHGKRGGY